MRCILLLSLFIVRALSDDEVLIIIDSRDSKTPAVPEVILQQAVENNVEPKTITEAYDRWYKIAYLVTLDSPSGPKPGLGLDNVYDSRGFPVPRLPDPYSLRMMLDPTNQTHITEYLDWRKAAMRRISLVANHLPEAALTRGLITPEVTTYGPSRPSDQKALGDYSHIVPESLGAPLLTNSQARELGIDDTKEIPRLPGEVSKSGIEVYWYWNHRCEYCTKMARTWFRFAKVVNKQGHKALSINTSPLTTEESIGIAGREVPALIEMWSITWGDDVDQARNWLDWTGTAKAFGITSTPTVVFINRKTPKYPKVLRLVGMQDDLSLQRALANVAGWPVDVWPPPAIEEMSQDAAPAAPSQPGTTPIPTR
jgi:hypothetical protein